MNEKTTVQSERIISHMMRDFWLLMKPELTLLSVFTALASAFMAIEVPDESQLIVFPLLAVGTLFVGGGSGALNQLIERREDGLMKRTQRRPLPDERILPVESAIFGSGIILFGLFILSHINILTAVLAFITAVTYLFLYTPLKKITMVSTIIGAVPGALPVLIGWASIQNSLSINSITLFAILYYWQIPHFYSIGWMYRSDYSNAGYRLLPNIDESGRKVSKYIIINQIFLLGIGIAPAITGLVTIEHVPISIAAGLIFLFFGGQFRRSLSSGTSGIAAKRLFFASLFYIPVIFSSMIIFKTS
jgi:protoheme IX farnesyltransferase